MDWLRTVWYRAIAPLPTIVFTMKQRRAVPIKKERALPTILVRHRYATPQSITARAGDTLWYLPMVNRSWSAPILDNYTIYEMDKI